MYSTFHFTLKSTYPEFNIFLKSAKRNRESYISIATLSSPKFNEEYFHLTGVHYIYNQRAENYIGVCLLFGV
jgi:hypothetical protein